MGAFIANYVGALLTDAMADMKPAGEDDYFADLDLNDVVCTEIDIELISWHQVENEKTNAINAHGNLDVDVGFCSDDDHSAKASDDSDAEEHVAWVVFTLYHLFVVAEATTQVLMTLNEEPAVAFVKSQKLS